MSSGRARFSAGWNNFIKINKLKKNDRLFFTLVEEDDCIVFMVDINRKIPLE